MKDVSQCPPPIWSGPRPVGKTLTTVTEQLRLQQQMTSYNLVYFQSYYCCFRKCFNRCMLTDTLYSLIYVLSLTIQCFGLTWTFSSTFCHKSCRCIIIIILLRGVPIQIKSWKLSFWLYLHLLNSPSLQVFQPKFCMYSKLWPSTHVESKTLPICMRVYYYLPA
jgi:hypothetical protein